MNRDTELMKTMFGPTPEGFSRAVQKGLCRRESRRAAPWKTAAAALALMLIVTGAYALTTGLGLLQLFDRNGNKYPPTLPDAIVTAQPQSITVGPLTFTLVESFSDPYQTYAACAIQSVDDEDCLFTWYDEVAIDFGSDAIVQQLSEDERLRLQLPQGTTYAQAARERDIPVYVINAQLSRSDVTRSMACRPSITRDEEGNALLAAHQVLSTPVDGPVDMTLTITVYTLDPSTGRPAPHLKATGTLQLTTTPVSITATGTYLPEQPCAIGPAELVSVRAEQSACGVYFTITSRSSTQVKPSPLSISYMLCLVDGDHRRLPIGISNTWRLSAPDWPLVVSWHPTALEELPEEIIVTDYEKKTGTFARLYREE